MPATFGSGAPSHTRLVQYAFWDLVRDHNLTSAHTVCLLVLLSTQHWRDPGTWLGSATELASYVRVSRNRIPLLVDDLAERGLVIVHRPFVQHGEALLEVADVEELLLLSAAQRRTLDARRNASQSRSNRAVNAPGSAFDQPERPNSKKASREEGDEGSARVPVAANEDEFVPDVCSVCGGPADSPVTGPSGALLCVDCEDSF